MIIATDYYVYIMGSANGRAIYIGVTNDIVRRVNEHKNGLIEGFTRKYRCHHLLYLEHYNDIRAAIDREKQLKGWTRAKKEALIKEQNPERIDLSARY